MAGELDAAGVEYVTYHGGVSSDQRSKNLKRFQGGGAKVFLGNQSAGGTGLNLAMADTMVYYSNDFNADTRWQSEDRAHRIGQKNNVTYVDLVAPKTIDGKILDALRKKKNVADLVMDFRELIE